MSKLRFEYLPYGPHNWLIREYYYVVFQKNVKLATEQAKKDGSVLDQFFSVLFSLLTYFVCSCNIILDYKEYDVILAYVITCRKLRWVCVASSKVLSHDKLKQQVSQDFLSQDTSSSTRIGSK